MRLTVPVGGGPVGYPAMHQARSFPDLAQCDALSKSAMESHLRLYEGYVQKYNELMEKLGLLQEMGPQRGGTGPDAESLKADVTFALGAVKNHELFFDVISPPPRAGNEEPSGALAECLVKSFHSLPQFLVDLKQTATLGRGWAFAAYDLEHDFLFNYQAGAQNGLPVTYSLPILAIDLYGHAYFYDFGNNRLAYVEAIMKSLNWEKVGERLATAKTIRAAVQTIPTAAGS